MAMRTILLVSAFSLAALPALALDSPNKVTFSHDKMTLTGKLGKKVPQMSSDAPPAVPSKAPLVQTYTSKIGELVPNMIGPKAQ